MPNANAIGDSNSVQFERAFDMVKFYEKAAGTVKSRTWTISAWIFSVNSALLAFCFSLPKETAYFFGARYSVIAACCAGMALCVALMILIWNQGEHLRDYLGYQQKSVSSNETLSNIIDLGNDAGFPGFCWGLLVLAALFLLGFLVTLLWAYGMKVYVQV